MNYIIKVKEIQCNVYFLPHFCFSITQPLDAPFKHYLPTFRNVNKAVYMATGDIVKAHYINSKKWLRNGLLKNCQLLLIEMFSWIFNN